MTDTSTPIHILVVDDEPILRDELVTFLGWHGMVATAADGGERALAVLAEDPAITVTLSDIRMAGLDGLGLAKAVLATRGEADAVEVVLMTGHGSMETATQALRAGVFDFLRKPMRLNDMLDVIRRAHAKAVGRRESEARRIAELARLRADYTALQERLAKTGAALGLSGETPPELAHILSHELRTPLVPLLALPDMLETGRPLAPGVLSAYLGDVRQAGARLVAITNDLVEFLAPPPPATFAWRTASAKGMIEAVRDRSAPAAEAAGVAVMVGALDAVDVETAVPQLLGALTRLVANALAATARGGEVEVSAEVRPGDAIAFSVRDFGAGMTAEDIALARLPFRQLDMSLTRRHGGLGLGLPLAERMAGLLGGRLEIGSTPGAGTVARIVLPRHRAGGSAA